jgi:general secretion pathway protein K
MNAGIPTGLPHRQRGVALITALVVVAICVFIAADLLRTTFLDQRRTAGVLHGDQARHYLLGAEDWVGHILRRNREDSQTDHLDEDWAMQLPALEVDGGYLTGHLDDLQGRFNINNLVGPEGQPRQEVMEQFQRLLIMLEIDPELANAVIDWIDPDQEPRFPGGAEDGQYLSMDPPYRSADQPMQAVSELRLVAGVDEDIYERLRPYVTTLPGSNRTHINVNTAPAPVLASLAEGLSPADGERLLEMQVNGGFETLEEFYELIGRNVPVQVGLTSNHFRLTARADIGSASMTMYSFLIRDDSGATFTWRRSFGTD